jgi:hypothetical protein
VRTALDYFKTIAQNMYQHSAGIYNAGVSDDTIHETGIGTSENDRRNAFEIYKNGAILAPELENGLIDLYGDKSLITKAYLQANNGISELEKIEEGGNTGWRIYGRDPANYSDIGQDAIDFSYSDNNNILVNGAAGYYAFAEGVETNASGLASHAAGLRTNANEDFQFVVGKWNSNQQSTLFEVGNGADISNRSNALEVYENGTALLPECTNSRIIAMGDKAIATKEYVDENAGSESQLEKISEGGAIGWRLLGWDPNNYGDIGDFAVDLSQSDVVSASHGAMGIYSFAVGLNNTAGGDYSAVEGRENFAGGDYSHSQGYQTRAEENYSSAEGYKTRASGIGSHAEGRLSIAVGDYSHVEGQSTQTSAPLAHAEGYETEARGTGSHAEGRGTISLRDYSHAGGQYNVGQEIDAIYEIGIGTGPNDRRNALVVYDNGGIVAPTSSILDIDNRGDKSLINKNTLI